jgi:hypothetical protein
MIHNLLENNIHRHIENRVLRRIIGPKRDKITTEWRRLHNKELYAPQWISFGGGEVHTGF